MRFLAVGGRVTHAGEDHAGAGITLPPGPAPQLCVEAGRIEAAHNDDKQSAKRRNRTVSGQ